MNWESHRSYYKNGCRFKMHWRHFKRRAGALWEILFLITFDCYSASSEIKVFFNQCNHHSLYKKPVKTFFRAEAAWGSKSLAALLKEWEKKMLFLRKSFCSPQNQLHVRLDWSLWLNKEISWKGHRKENPITTFSLKSYLSSVWKYLKSLILIFKVKGKGI